MKYFLYMGNLNRVIGKEGNQDEAWSTIIYSPFFL